MEALKDAAWDTDAQHAVYCSACAVTRWYEVLVLVAHEQVRGCAQAAVVKLAGGDEIWLESARETWAEVESQQQMGEVVFLAPVRARRELLTPSQSAARAAARLANLGTPPNLGLVPAPGAGARPAGLGSAARPVQPGAGPARPPLFPAPEELQETVDQRVMPVAGLSELMAKITSLEAVVRQQGAPAPELRFFATALGGPGQRACVWGLADGYKRETPGNPSTKEAFAKVNWLGMKDGKLDKLKTQRLIGADRIDQFVQHKGLPEAQHAGEVIILGEGVEIHTSARQAGIPERFHVIRYLTALARDWSLIRRAQEGVYAREHPDYEYFQCMSAVIVGRLEFLKQTAMFMMSEGDYSWQVTWRYMMLFVDQYYEPVRLESRSGLDQAILEARMDKPNREDRMHALVVESIKPLELEKARRLAKEFFSGYPVGEVASKAGASSGAGSGGGKVSGAKQECSLCYSTSHGYGAGVSGPKHSASDRIEKKCPVMLSDNKPCDLLHAFSGEAKTPCRGGLERQKGPGGRPILAKR